MKKLLLVLNDSLLFMCVSMYLGTGWSMVLFSFTVLPDLTVQNYYLEFVPQVYAAMSFFTYQTIVMLVLGSVMIWANWNTRYRLAAILLMVLIITATGITLLKAFPLNAVMAAHITDPQVLKDTLAPWEAQTWVRVGFWTAEWLVMMYYFAGKLMDQPEAANAA
jgi:hypothetical protein